MTGPDSTRRESVDARRGGDAADGQRHPARRRGRLVPTLAAIAVVATTVSLGQWQLRRADEKRAMQARIDAALASPAVAVPPAAVPASSLDGRRVIAEGSWDAAHTIYVDNRTYRGVAGFHVVTPVRIGDSQLYLLVMRGWVAHDPRDRTKLPVVPTPSGRVRVEGIAQADIPQVLELGSSAPPGPQDRIWQNVDLDRFAQWSGLALQPVLVRQSAQGAPDDGLTRDWPVAGPDVGKHIGYAVQWFAMAAVTVGLWIYFSFFRRSERDED